MTTTAPADTSTTTLPTGSTDELLARLVARAPELSHLIVQDSGQRELLAELDALWARSRADVDADSPALAGQLDAAMALLHSGVDQRRPADADRGALNLATLAAAYARTAAV